MTNDTTQGMRERIKTDFPTAWKVLGADSIPTEMHHEKCSTRQTQGAVLCDCAAEKAFINTAKLANEFIALAVSKERERIVVDVNNCSKNEPRQEAVYEEKYDGIEEYVKGYQRACDDILSAIGRGNKV